MAELEKVIRGLELCLQGDSNFCELSCPYYQQCGAFYENNEALLKDALSLLKTQEPGWISVKDRMPENGKDILAYLNNGEETRIAPCNYYNGVWYDSVMNCVCVMKDVTHWMSLPIPPKEGT